MVGDSTMDATQRWCVRPIMCAALALALLCASLPQSAHASVMGVDLGLSYIKVSVARPGKGLELVTNEQSKRKTPAAVGFTTEGERLFGDAAVAYSGKAPTRVILDGRSLIGKCVDEPTEDDLSCSRNVTTVEGSGEFAGEHVVAMLLGMASKQASAALDGATIKDVVITVPAWFDQKDRAAIADASRVIGLNCLGVVNANTAAAVKYALDGKAKLDPDALQDPSKTKKKGKAVQHHVMFYDVGASGATATIAQILADPKTGSASSVKILGHAWEQGVGGRALDTIIIEKLADDFDAQRDGKGTPSRELPRVMMRLRKESQRVREILSANTETQVAVPSLFDDIDLRTVATRQAFEEKAAPLFERAVAPAKRVLTMTGISVEDLDAIVPFGGASRTPRLQELLCKELGISALNKSINSDEAAVMGTAFIAASLSNSFRVKKIDFEETFPRAISADISKDRKSGSMFSGNAKDEYQSVVVFSAQTAKMPGKKTLNFKRKDDFSVSVYLEEDKSGVERFAGRTLYTKFKVSGVSKVLKKLKDSSKAKSLTPQIALTIALDASGRLRVTTAESSVDETVVVEREVPVVDDADEKAKSKKGDGKKSGDKTKEEASDSAGSKPDDENDSTANADTDAKKDASGSNAKDEKSKPKTKIEKSSQTLVHRQTLEITYEEDKRSLAGSSMTKDDIEASKKVLKKLEDADVQRQERAEALNALEGFVLEARSTVRSLDEDDHMYMVSTEAEREAMVATFDEAEDWMYTDEAKELSNLKKKLAEVRVDYDAVANRAKEAKNRPKAIATAKKALENSIELLKGRREQHEAAGSKHLKTFDDVLLLADEIAQWIKDKEAEQAALPSTAKPAFTVADLSAKTKPFVKQAGAAIALAVPEAKTDDADGKKDKSDEKTKKAKDTDTVDDVVVDDSKGNLNATTDDEPGGDLENPSVNVEGSASKDDASSAESETHDEL